MDRYPKIDTVAMTQVIVELTKGFRGVETTPALWICGRSSTFGLRPSLIEEFLPGIMRGWTEKLERGYIVATPIVFYTCKSGAIEIAEAPRGIPDEEFLVYNHYNILLSYIDSSGKIQIERYEPAFIDTQGNLQLRMEKTVKNVFRQYSPRDVKFSLVAERGLQALNKDTTLCGHHILYWMVYRLKYGKKASAKMLSSEESLEKFRRFCVCVTKLQTHCGECAQIV